MKANGRCAVKFVISFSLALIAVGSTAQAKPPSNFKSTHRESAGTCSVMIYREADFGNDISLTIYVDGVLITSLCRGEGYQATVRPGHHVISVGSTPCPYGKTKRTNRAVDFGSGKYYVFTAVWDVETILLDEGRHLPRQWYY